MTVSEEAIRVEEEFAPVRRDAMVSVAGAVLEFHQMVQVGRSMAWWTCRVPIAALAAIVLLLAWLVARR